MLGNNEIKHMKKIISIDGMHCEHCSARVIRAFEGQGMKCSVSLESGTATVTGDAAKMSDGALRDAVEALGFDVVNIREA